MTDLRQRMQQDMRIRNLSPRTTTRYTHVTRETLQQTVSPLDLIPDDPSVADDEPAVEPPCVWPTSSDDTPPNTNGPTPS